MIIDNYGVFCLFAEHVRPEQSNKSTIIGVYNERTAIDAEAKNLPFGMYIQVSPTPPSGTKTKLRLTLNNETVLEVPAQTPEQNETQSEIPTMVLALTASPIPIEEESRIEAFLTIGDLPESRIGLLKVTLNKSKA